MTLTFFTVPYTPDTLIVAGYGEAGALSLMTIAEVLTNLFDRVPRLKTKGISP